MSPLVTMLSKNLGIVQGITSMIYSICMTLMAYATYQLAETTIWPILTQRTFDLVDIDRYLSTTRGSLASAPFALLHSRRRNQLAVLLVAIVISLLLKADAGIVGYTFNTGMVPTPLLSEQHTQGGMGLYFKQMNPPSPRPGAVTVAMADYLTWATAQVEEPMWQQRNFVVDRKTLRALGNFTAKAVEMNVQQNCSARPIDISGDVFNVSADGARRWSVPTSFQSKKVSLRLQSQLTVWVDATVQTSNTSATTTLVFAAINGDIEGGFVNIPPEESDMYQQGYTAVSTLACDVSVELNDSFMCTDPSDECRYSGNQDVTLSDLDHLLSPGDEGRDGVHNIAVWLGAMPSVVGISVSGAQPLFEAGHPLPDQNNVTLPVPWTSESPSGSYPAHNWTQAQLTAFINSSAGSLATALTQRWATDTVILPSSKLLKRMQTLRSFLLLVPVAITLVSVVLMLILTSSIHHSCNVPNIRLGTTTEMIENTQNPDMEDVVTKARKEPDVKKALSKVKVRYGVLAEGGIGLGRKENVLTLRRGVGGRDFA